MKKERDKRQETKDKSQETRDRRKETRAHQAYPQGVLQKLLASIGGLEDVVEVGDGKEHRSRSDSNELLVDHVHLDEEAAVGEDAREDLDILLQRLDILSSWLTLFDGQHGE